MVACSVNLATGSTEPTLEVVYASSLTINPINLVTGYCELTV